MAKSHTQQFNIEAGRAVKAIKSITSAAKDYNKAVKESTREQKSLSTSTDKVKTEFRDLSRNYKAAATEIERTKNQLFVLRGEIKAQTRDIVRLSAQMFVLKETTKQTASSMRSASLAAERLKEDLKGAARSTRDFGRAIERDAAGVRSIIVHLRDFGKEIRGITRHMRTKNLTLEQQTKAAVADRTATSDLTVALSLMAKVIEATLVHRALNALIEGIRDSITEAKELSKRIAEVQTVSLEMSNGVLETAKGTREWRNELLALSQNFGIPVLEQTEALYEALSNQVIEAGDATKFMSEEMKLAITTVSTLDEAVDTTSTVINAFNKDVSETARINAVLFKAVDVGRFRLNELGSQFGRVSVLSNQLGISFEEQAGAIALLTRLGLKADVAQTLLTNVQLKLIKPTEAMVELFNQWGVTSGRAAISTFGFQGVLQKMAEAANQGTDSMQEMGEIFQDLRAITGAAGLIGNLGKLEQTIKEVSNSTEAFNKAFELSIEALGRKADIQLEKLRQAFLVKFGEPVLRVMVELAESIGGADKALDIFIKTLAAGSAALIAYRTTLLAAAIQTGTLSAGTIALRGSVAGLAAVIALVALEAATMESNLEAALISLNANLIESARVELEKTDDALAKLTETAIVANREQFQAYFRAAAGVRAVNIALTEDFEKKFKRIKIAIRDGLDVSADLLTDRLRDLEKAADDARKAFEDAEERVFKGRFEEFDRRFAADIAGKSDEDAITAITGKRLELEKAALDALARGDIKRAEELFKRVDDFAIEAERRLRELKDKAEKDTVEIKEKLDLVGGGLTRTVTTDDTRIRLGLGGRPTRRTRGGVPRRTGIATVEKRTEEIADLEKIKKIEEQLVTLENTRRAGVAERLRLETEFAAKKKAEAEALKAEVKVREKNLELFKNLITQVDTFDTTQPGAAGKFGALLDKTQAVGAEAGLSPTEQLTFLRQAFAQRVLLAREAATAEAKIRLDTLQKALDQAKEKEEKALRDRQAAASRFASGIEAFGAQNIATAERLRREFDRPGITKQGQISKIDPIFGVRRGTPELKEVQAAIENFDKLNQKLLDTRRKGGDVSLVLEQIAKAQERLNVALDKINKDRSLVRQGLFSDPKPERNEDGEILFPRVPGKPKESLSDQVDKSRAALQKLRDLAGQVNQSMLTETQTRAQINLLLQETQQRLQGIRLQHEAIIRLQQQEAAALEAARTAPPPGFAHGGFVGRGTDRTLAALSDGEVVMNRLASRTYAPLLRAMNKEAPLFRSQGGEVTNNYGDIHVTTSGGTSDAQVLEIAQKVQRLRRRGVL